MIRRNPDLILVMAAALACCILTMFSISSLIRVVLGLPFALLFPGYAIAAAFFVRRMRFILHLLFCVVLSVCVLIFGGLLLHLTIWGLTPISFSLFLLAIITTACLVAALRRRARRASVELHIPDWRPKQIVFFSATAILLVIAFVITSAPAPTQGLEGYTQFWILQKQANDPKVIQIGISNQEFSEQSYLIQITAGDNNVLLNWPSIDLKTGEVWKMQVTLPSGVYTAPIKARLYLKSQPGRVYREVWLSPLDHSTDSTAGR